MPQPRTFLVLAALALLVAAPSRACGDEREHQHPHDAGSLGAVSFPTSCDPQVQAEFDRAVALLHSFGYEAARNGFLSVAERDPTCAMAQWGIAMSHYHQYWAPPSPAELDAGRAAAERASGLAAAASEREQGYVAAIAAFYRDAERLDHRTRALAYRAGLEEVLRRFPDDSEARIFHALSLLSTAAPADTTYAQQKQAAEILNALLPAMPDHPGIAHYVIHAFDYPELASLALPAANAYARIAPASSHAQHMPSHIFTRLGLWEESIASNLASEASANEIVRRSHPGAASFDALHALDYLEYAYLQLCRDGEARRVLERAAVATTFDNPNFAAGYALAAIPARWALERGLWSEAAAAALPAAGLPWERFPYALAVTHFARALGRARTGDAEGARASIAELQAIRDGLAAAPLPGPYDWAEQVEAMRGAAAGWLAHAEGRSQEAVETLRAAAALEERVGKHAVTPGAVLPARELLGELLLVQGRPAEALAEFEAALATTPNRLNAFAGAARAAEAAGDAVRARELSQQVLAQCDGASGREALAQARARLARVEAPQR